MGNPKPEVEIPVLVIVGPTAVGKTEAAVLAAEQMNGEIVSADSRQIYRGMDVGTAKPEPEFLRRVPHHLLDVGSPAERFNAVRFARLARRAIADIHGRGRLALVVGGSGLYLRALLDGLFLGPPASAPIRAQLSEVADRRGVGELHARLAEVDPDSARRIHPNDRVRLVRALEVFLLTGDPMSRLRERIEEDTVALDATWVGLARERVDLYGRIDARVDAMIEAGWVEEVRRLESSGSGPKPGLDAVGYREILTFLRGERHLEAAVALIKRNTRRYAKRQITWFSKDARISWIALGPATPAEEVARQIMSRFAERRP